jgi:hypothetical protein
MAQIRDYTSTLTPEKQLAMINWALDDHSIECILFWMQKRLPAQEIKSLDAAFKRWLYRNPFAFKLFMQEYAPVYHRAKELEGD